jgi:hypothetical protein
LKARARNLLRLYTEREEQTRRDEERRIAEEERQREVERQKQEARLLDKPGQKDLAAAVRRQPVEAPVVVLPSAVPEVAGLSYRDEWTWTVVGGDSPENRKRAIVAMVGPEYGQFLKFDDAALNAFAHRTKGTIKVPGLQFFKRKIPVRR